MKKYDHKKIEKKWQKYWEKNETYKTKEGDDKPKYYVLDMFPYPSGAGLHVGHPKGYIATDIIARMKMMQGYNVLHPMGWDAFGLPAENYAIKNKVHPAVATEKNITVFKKQLDLLGLTYDWSREVNTTDPKYYKWTQWAFIEMFKRGLAFESYEPINWCPGCKTGLANEDLENGLCERCGSQVEQKPMRQWVLKITDYAERMLKDLDQLKDWPESIKTMQKEWIGKSEGVNFKHKVKDLGIEFEVYDSVPQTFLAQTFVIIAPEHPLVEKLVKDTDKEKEVKNFVERIKAKKLSKKFDIETDMEGVFTGRYSENYMGTGRDLPIWVASFALMGYGTGIVGCSAHDERDFKFAKKYNIPLHEVTEPLTVKEDGPDAFREDMPITERTAAVCVVKHWLEDKYMGIRWKKNDWQGFVIGGIEAGEEVGITGAREIAEETGYKNVEFVKELGGKVHGKFFQAVKQENRFAHFVPALFKLKNDEQVEIAKDEKALHEVVWLTPEEMDEFVNRDDMRIVWSRVRGNEQPIIHNGILLEPEEFKGREWSEVREDIIQYIVDKGLGSRAIHYKLRDWVFSRQRYWGEPIPLVHCEKCTKNVSSVFTFHAIGSNSKTAWHEWLDGELKSRGIESITPNLPNADEPKMREWVDVAAKFYGEGISDNSVVIGRSLGVRAALKFAEDHKLGKLILVCPTLDGDEKYWEEIKRDNPDFPVKFARAFNSVEIDYQKVQKNVSEIIFLFSHDDPYIPFEFEQHYRNNFPGAVFKVYDKAGHFGESSGFRTFPDLLNLIINQNPGWVPVPEKELPLELPKVKNYEPSGTGESPLVNITDWVNTKCPVCGGAAKRETNTMPQWAGSCWYYLRYIDPNNSNALVDKEKEKYWSPIDLYVGGAEHATRHLIYARFWHKFLYDIGAVSYPEPFTRLQNVGLILASDGRKMSKRWGNVINPDDVVEEYGADAMRLYEMFMGPFDQPCAWSMQGLVGAKRFLEKVWALQEKVGDDSKADSKLVTLAHQTIKKVTEDIVAMRFNTAISQLMIFVNELVKTESVSKEMYLTLIKLLSPFAPHLADELFEKFNSKGTIFESDWPKYDINLAKDEFVTLAVQVNGKLRDTLEVAADITEEEAKKLVLGSEKVQKWLEGKEPKKVIYIKGKLISIVV